MFRNAEYDGLKKAEKKERLRETARVFLKLGFLSFGGPAAHIAMMDEEVVGKRRWLTREAFADLIGAVNLIPGPNSTELAIHLGFVRGGVAGLFVAGLSFILPALSMVVALAWAYARFGSLPPAQGLLWGMKPVILAVVALALARLFRTVARGFLSTFIFAASLALSLVGVGNLYLLLGAGAVAAAVENRDRLRLGALPALALGAAPLGEATRPVLDGAALSPLSLFLSFLKIGSVLYGSGYVLLSFLEAEFVRGWGVLSRQQLLDAVAAGQFTPGPVFTTAGFVGYLLGGFSGALAAAGGIFLPSFLLVLLLSGVLPRMRQSRWVSGALKGVNAASLGLMAAVGLTLGREALADWMGILLFTSALILLWRTKINSAWLILAGAGIGLIRQMLG